MAVTAARDPYPVATSGERQPWIDNLRVIVIAGVIGAHVSLIYALDVGWYYEERTAGTATKVILAALFSPGLPFGMGLLFFVAGLFTPPTLARKGVHRFTVDRVWRLGVPTLAYLFVVNPAMNLLGDRAMGDGESIGDFFRRTYRDDIALGVAWFIAALLLFSVGYAIWRSRRPVDARRAGALHRRALVRAAAFVAVGSFVVRLRSRPRSRGETACATSTATATSRSRSCTSPVGTTTSRSGRHSTTGAWSLRRDRPRRAPVSAC